MPRVVPAAEYCHSRAGGNPVGHCRASRPWHAALAAAALLLLLVPAAATAQTYWQAGTGDWFEPAHWTAGVPTTSISAWIDNGGTAQIASPGAHARDLFVGNESLDPSFLEIIGGGELGGRYSYVGREADSRGMVTVMGSGSRWSSSSLYLGYYGTAILNIADGGLVSTSNMGYLGYEPGSEGTATLTGTGSRWRTQYGLSVGHRGTGTLNVNDGGEVSLFPGFVAYTSYLGRYAGSHGTVTVTGSGSTWTGSQNLYVGREGTGTLTIGDGGRVSSDAGYLGYASGSQGTATVSGSGSKWSNPSSLRVAVSGTGTLNIEDGGEVSNLYGYVGRYSGSHGTVTVTGSGSKWGGWVVYVGYEGAGALTIADGGWVASTTGGVLGYESGSQGTATVTGSGSQWTNPSGGLSVGYRGTGTLRIADGGAVSATAVSINSQSLLAIDVGQGSLLAVGGGSGTITNDGAVRILAGADATPGAEYAPIAAGTWSGTGSYVGVGGTWNAASRRLIASEVEYGISGAPILMDLSERQRVLINDASTGWSLGASFPAKTGAATQFTFTATAASGAMLGDLESLLEPGRSVWGAWDLSAAGSGYSPSDPVYLSFEVGVGLPQGELDLWYHDGVRWSPFSAVDLTYSG